MQYDPFNPAHHRILATDIVASLEAAGFADESAKHPRTKEMVFSRVVSTSPAIRVLVYTTIVHGAVRKEGKDAIKVCAVYTRDNGDDRGIVSARSDKHPTGRVNRTGTTEGITGRMVDRMREVWLAGKVPCTCNDCGAPTFMSKARKASRGRPAKVSRAVCAEVCWTKRNAA
jgi:hypothetical protein